MRTCVNVGVLALMAASVSVATLAGCASPDQSRMEVRDSAASLRKSLATAPAQVDTAMNALYQATSGDTSNRLERVRDFKAKLVTLREDARFIGNHSSRARADAAAYFKQWAAEAVAADPSKKVQMTPVMEGRVSNYETALSYLDGGRDSYKALVADLTEVEKALDANMADAASPAVSKHVHAAKLHSVDLKNYIAVLSDKIDSSLAKK
jgi:hypothetical protein